MSDVELTPSIQTNPPAGVDEQPVNDAANASARLRGRPTEHRLAEDIAIICALSLDGSTTSPADLAALLSMSEQRARDALSALGTEAVTAATNDEVVGPVLPLCSTGDGGAVARIEAPGALRCKPLRLTHAQAQACAAAFEQLGLSEEHELRRRVEAAFFPLDDSKLTYVHALDARAEVHPTTPSTAPSKPFAALMTCAGSIAQASVDPHDATSVSAPVVQFRYRGTNDLTQRSRRIVPVALRIHEQEWLVDGFDIDARAQRTFRLVRMEQPELTDQSRTVPTAAGNRPDGGRVSLTCAPAVAKQVLAWEGAQLVSSNDERAVIDVPYFRGDWLPRHVLALGREVTHHDKRLADEMRDIAAADLKLARRHRSRT